MPKTIKCDYDDSITVSDVNPVNGTVKLVCSFKECKDSEQYRGELLLDFEAQQALMLALNDRLKAAMHTDRA